MVSKRNNIDGVLFDDLCNAFRLLSYYKACMEIRVMQEHNHSPLVSAGELVTFLTISVGIVIGDHAW